MRHIFLKFFVLSLGIMMIGSCATGCGKEALYLEANAQVQNDGSGELEETDESEKEVATQTDALSCFVYICGAVRNPGVYEMPVGSRVYEVIKKAGGLKKDAALETFNQAEVVSDGQMIEISTYKEQEIAVAEQAAADNGLVNLNTATVAQLMTLSGIGEAKATAIVSYREEHGAFTTKEELKNVSGIGESTFASIKDQITV